MTPNAAAEVKPSIILSATKSSGYSSMVLKARPKTPKSVSNAFKIENNNNSPLRQSIRGDLDHLKLE